MVQLRKKLMNQAYLLDNDAKNYEIIEFEPGKKNLKKAGKTYSLAPEKFFRRRIWHKPITFLPFVFLRWVYIIYFDVKTQEALDCVYVGKKQRYKMMNPVLMNIILKSKLEQEYYRGLISVGGKRIISLKLLLAVFVVIAVVVFLANYYGVINLV